MSTSDLRILLVGLPGTGKTSFTAALWNLLESDTDQTGFEVVRLGTDREYLNQIRRTWLRIDNPERTRFAAGIPVNMHLRARDSRRTVELEMPDRSGEAYEVILEDREWPADFGEFVARVDGILLFLHPDHVVEPTTIEEVNATRAVIAGALNQNITLSGASGTAIEPWSADALPTQVKLVDLLQLITGEDVRRRQLRIAVVISAWDVLGNSPPVPETWLESRLPLLHQFLSSNRDRLSFQVYAVSAYGGDPTTQASELRSQLRPADRPVIFGPGAMAHDLTAPLTWIAGG